MIDLNTVVNEIGYTESWYSAPAKIIISGCNYVIFLHIDEENFKKYFEDNYRRLLEKISPKSKLPTITNLFKELRSDALDYYLSNINIDNHDPDWVDVDSGSATYGRYITVRCNPAGIADKTNAFYIELESCEETRTITLLNMLNEGFSLKNTRFLREMIDYYRDKSIVRRNTRIYV